MSLTRIQFGSFCHRILSRVGHKSSRCWYQASQSAEQSSEPPVVPDGPCGRTVFSNCPDSGETSAHSATKPYRARLLVLVCSCSCSCSPALPLACSTASPHSPMRSAPAPHWSSSPSSATTSTVCTSVEFNWRLICQVKAGCHDSISSTSTVSLSTSTMRNRITARR